MQNPLSKNLLSPLKRRFRGGVYIKQRSTSGEHMLLRNVPFVELPLSSRGEALTPCVTEGQRVLCGESLTLPTEEGERLIATVSGEVSFCDVLAEGANPVPAIHIENDYQYENMPFDDERELDREVILERLDRAYVCCGSTPLVKMIDRAYADAVLLIRALDTDAYITSVRTCALDFADEVIGGVEILLRVFPSAHIAVDEGDEELISLYTEKLRDKTGIFILPIKAKYPRDDRRILASVISGRRAGSSLAERSCTVIDAYTAAAVYRAVMLGESDTMRMVSVSGNAISGADILAPIGTAYSNLAAACGGYAGSLGRIVAGNTLAGSPLYTDSVPLSRASEGFLAFEGRNTVKAGECINCALCVKVCPVGLLPAYIYKFASSGIPEQGAGLHADECIGCGACDYVCPAALPLAVTIKSEKRGEQNG